LKISFALLKTDNSLISKNKSLHECNSRTSCIKCCTKCCRSVAYSRMIIVVVRALSYGVNFNFLWLRQMYHMSSTNHSTASWHLEFVVELRANHHCDYCRSSFSDILATCDIFSCDATTRDMRHNLCDYCKRSLMRGLQ